MTFDERIKKKTSVKTTFHDIKAASGELERIAHDLHSVKTVLCCLAYAQDDKTITVPIQSLNDMPPGIELEIRFDRERDEFVFKCILPCTNDQQNVGELPTDGRVK